MSYPFINEEDFEQQQTSKTCGKELGNTGLKMYIQQFSEGGLYNIAITGRGNKKPLYSVKTLEDCNLLFEDLSEYMELIKTVYNFNNLEEALSFFKDLRKYAAPSHETFRLVSEDGLVVFYVKTDKNIGFTPWVIDIEKGTNTERNNFLASTVPTYVEAMNICKAKAEEYELNGYYTRDLKNKPKYILEHELVETKVEEPKVTVELTKDQLAVLETIFKDIGGK